MPIGLILMWLKPTWNIKVKLGVTGAIVALVIAMTAYSSSPAGKAASAAYDRQQAAEATAAKAQEAKDAAAQAARDRADAAAAQRQRAAAAAAEMRVTADQLAAAYDANEIAANKQYDHKKFIVTGRVSEIATAIGALDVTVTGPNGGSVVCYFDKDANDQLAALEKGQRIAIEGTGGGAPVGLVMMSDCTIVSAT